jgi:cellulose synthase/poly-beta-1,6-N-acetylglucosamine synthase-like glycosyltransferase
MDAILLVLNILEVIVFAYLGLASCYVLFFSLFGLLPYRVNSGESTIKRRIAVLIPGYKEDSVILEVAEHALNQKYPVELFDVVIIADSFKQETIDQLNTFPLKVVEVSFEKSTKSKALNAAMSVIGDNYDIAVVLDADNLMESQFLSKINDAFSAGFRVVQGHRKAKNTNTTLALLDTISEEINNHIFRKGHRVVGLSSALIGSGMAFDYKYFKTTMKEIKAVGGFDKELELTLLRAGIKIEYLEDAVVLDEKVQKEAVFENQRRRWLSAQFVYFKRFALDGFVQFFSRFNIDYFDKVYQMIQPPRILLLGLLSIITISSGLLWVLLDTKIAETIAISFGWWFSIWIFTVVALLLSIPGNLYSIKTFVAILSLPRGFWLMLKSLLRLKDANKTFIHTQHGIESEKSKQN